MTMFSSETGFNPNRSQAAIIQNWKWVEPPLVSVCCITYNHEAYVEQALESFLMQETDFPFEILIHDDASTDGTASVVRNYEKLYPQIVKAIYQSENQYSKEGGFINVKYNFFRAKGNYIALCEGDDYWTDKTKLQKQVLFLEGHPDYVITYTRSQPFDHNGVVNIDFGGARRDVSADELKKGVPLCTLTTCFRNVITETPRELFSAKLVDRALWSLLGAHGKGKYLSDITPSAYRVHDGGIHSKKSKVQKIEASLTTSNALFCYYTRLGEAKYARFYLERSLKLSLLCIGIKGLLKLAFDSHNLRLAFRRLVEKVRAKY